MHPGFDPQPNGDGTAVFVFFVRAVGAVDLFVDLPGSSGIYTRLPTTINRLDRTTIVLLRVLHYKITSATIFKMVFDFQGMYPRNPHWLRGMA